MPDKKAILARLHQKAAAGVPIIGTGAGTGLTAKAEAEGDTDLIIAYATGSFRMAWHSTIYHQPAPACFLQNLIVCFFF